MKLNLSKLFWLKAVMWFCFIQWSCPGRFLSVFFVDIGLSESQIGILYGVQKCASSIATPIWSFIADKIKNRYIIYQTTIIGSGIGILLLGVPYFILKLHNSTTMFICMIISCSIYFVLQRPTGSLQDSLVCLDNKDQYGSIRMHGAISWGITHILVGVMLDFALDIQWTLPLATLMSIPWCIVGHIAFGPNSKKDSNSNLKSNSESKKSMNSNQAKSEQNEPKQTQLLSVDSIDDEIDDSKDDENGRTKSVELQSISNKLSKKEELSEYHELDESTQPNSDETANTEQTEHLETVSIREFLGFMIAKPSTISLYFLMFSVGGGQAVATSLLFPYVLDIGTQRYSHFLYSLLGLSVAVTVIFEIPIFHISEWVIQRMGYKNMMILGAALLIIRCFGYSLLNEDTLWCLVFIEPLHGTTFALMQLSTVNIMFDLFGEKYAATAQGSANSIKSGVGPLVFMVTAGFVMQYVSGQWMYRGVALWLIFALMAFVFTTRNEQFNSVHDK